MWFPGSGDRSGWLPLLFFHREATWRILPAGYGAESDVYARCRCQYNFLLDRAEVEEELKYKLEEMGSNDASEEALELLEAAVTREQNNKENNQ